MVDKLIKLLPFVALPLLVLLIGLLTRTIRFDGKKSSWQGLAQAVGYILIVIGGIKLSQNLFNGLVGVLKSIIPLFAGIFIIEYAKYKSVVATEKESPVIRTDVGRYAAVFFGTAVFMVFVFISLFLYLCRHGC